MSDFDDSSDRGERAASGDLSDSLTKVAFGCVHRSLALAKIFNHSVTRPVHLIAAMAATPRAAQRLAAQGFAADFVLAAALEALGKIEREDLSDKPVELSADLIEILNSAITAAEESANIDDIVTAFTKISPADPAARILRSSGKSELSDIKDTLVDLRQDIEDLKSALSHSNTDQFETRLTAIERLSPVDVYEFRSLQQDFRQFSSTIDTYFSDLRSELKALAPERQNRFSTSIPTAPATGPTNTETGSFGGTQAGPRSWPPQGTESTYKPAEPISGPGSADKTDPQPPGGDKFRSFF